MRGHRKREKLGRLGAFAEDGHWFGEGIAGQESLADDLDPYLYAVDGALCHEISRLAFQWQNRDERPFAILVPAPGEVPWQVGFLAKYFDVAILAESFDPVLETVAERFDALLLHDEALMRECNRAVDVVVFTRHIWPSVSAFHQELCRVLPHLSDRARIFTAVSSAQERSSGAGVTDLIDALEGRDLRCCGQSSENLAGIGSQQHFGIESFLKRHADFFGRHGRDICLFRMYRDDFHSQIAGEGAERNTVSLLQLGCS